MANNVNEKGIFIVTGQPGTGKACTLESMETILPILEDEKVFEAGDPVEEERESPVRVRNINEALPHYGEIWKVRDDTRRLIVLGNNVDSSSNTIWCADQETGRRVDALVSEMQFIEAPHLSETIEKCKNWARTGNDNAAWWLGWFYEGVHHPKSVWYYITALRLNPNNNAWAVFRIYSDSFNPGLCRGTVKPDLNFLSDIPEFWQIATAVEIEQSVAHIECGDWRDAVAYAEVAVHAPLTN